MPLASENRRNKYYFPRGWCGASEPSDMEAKKNMCTHKLKYRSDICAPGGIWMRN